MEIVIKETKIPLRFSFGLLMMLATLWNEKFLENVVSRLAAGVDEKGDPVEGQTPVQLFYDVVDIVKCAAKIAGTEIDATDEEIMDAVFSDFSIVGEIVKNLIEALPKPKQETNPDARKK